MDWHFIFSWLKIVVLDLTLAGDNALVIAMAVRTLPFRQQRVGICLGALGAVIVRVSLTFAAAQLLLFPYVQLTGGLLLVWIAIKLLRQDSDSEPAIQHCTSLFEAIRIIILADVIMSMDNILAIAGASEGSPFLVLLGLGLSIPIVVLGATCIAILMKHCNWIIYLGAGILGEVAAKMILEDNLIQATVGEVPTRLEWEIRIGLAVLVVVIGFLLARRSEKCRIRFLLDKESRFGTRFFQQFESHSAYSRLNRVDAGNLRARAPSLPQLQKGHLGRRGYYVSTVGRDEAQIREYMTQSRAENILCEE